MPDRRASLFIRLVLQNGGRLSATTRRQFVEITDDEIEMMAAACRTAIRAERQERS